MVDGSKCIPNRLCLQAALGPPTLWPLSLPPSPALVSPPHLQLLLNATDDVTPDASEAHVNARIAKIDLATNAQSRVSMDWSTTWTQHNTTQHSSLSLPHETNGEFGRVTPSVPNGSRSDPVPVPSHVPATVLVFLSSPHWRKGQTSLPSLSQAPFKVQINVDGI